MNSVPLRREGLERSARFFDLANERLRVRLTNHGARIVRLWAPGRDGSLADVVLGFDTIDEYVRHASQYLGATIGRVANRIAGATFTLDGVAYELARNDGANHLHGGSSRSFDKVIWSASVAADGRSVRFSHVSPHLEEGYPADVSVDVDCRLGEDELRIDYRASADSSTPLNLTSHPSWNLAGIGAATALDHELWVDAPSYTPTNRELIPTGKIVPVDGTAFDFREPRLVGDRISELRDMPGGGYDHNFALARSDAGLRLVARLRHHGAGRRLEILTTQPGLQLYSGNFLPTIAGKAGRIFGRHAGICLEPQGFPDAVHQPSFPSIVVRPGEEYRHTTVYRFASD